MAIQPIDLQTLFTQVDKIGKTQAAQREGLEIQQAIQGAHTEKKTEEHIQSVIKTQDAGEGPEKIKDRNAGQQESGTEGGKKQDGEKSAEEKPDAVFRDPTLGRNIDISL